MATRNSTMSAVMPGASDRVSRRSVKPRASFSVDAVVQERFRKMVRFKRVLATYGLIDSKQGVWNLSERDAVDELVNIFEINEDSFKESARRSSVWNSRSSRFGTRASVVSASPNNV
mmetsp:Transcript_21475/g.50059  ORF Transcript_21475/g.50059 Transcript_21475/m.50059 type:complete len:117 (+) Transcript_21475:48-398(+)